MRVAVLVFVLSLVGGVMQAQAQTFTTSSLIKWDAPSNVVDVADATSLTYRLYMNGSTTGIILNFVACLPAVAPDVVFSCSAPVQSSMLAVLNKRKAFTTLTAEDTTPPATGESPASNVFVVNRKPNSPLSNRLQQ